LLERRVNVGETCFLLTSSCLVTRNASNDAKRAGAAKVRTVILLATLQRACAEDRANARQYAGARMIFHLFPGHFGGSAEAGRAAAEGSSPCRACFLQMVMQFALQDIRQLADSGAEPNARRSSPAATLRPRRTQPGQAPGNAAAVRSAAIS
jgi:hypothetical protein